MIRHFQCDYPVQSCGNDTGKEVERYKLKLVCTSVICGLQETLWTSIKTYQPYTYVTGCSEWWRVEVRFTVALFISTNMQLSFDIYEYVLCCWVICWFVVILGHKWDELTKVLKCKANSMKQTSP